MKNFEHIIGYESIKNELNTILDMVESPEKYEKLGAYIPKGLLLHGEPGVGKTTFVNDFIKASKLEYFIIRKDIPDGEFVKHIKEMFAKAKQASLKGKYVIVFLDDFDKFANDDFYHRNSEEFVTIQTSIDEVKDNKVLVIGTANDLDNIPDSLLRAGRFDRVVQVNNPTLADASKIVEYYLSKKNNVGKVNCDDIARILDGGSCAQLETVINEAAILAAYNNQTIISMENIIKAALRVIYDAPISCDVNESKYLNRIAYHEAGHVVLNEILEPGSTNLVSIQKYDSQKGGITSYTNNEDYFYSQHFAENRIRTLLAGKASSEIIFGEPDVGCSSDLSRAYNIISRIVGDYCSNGFGFIDINSFENKGEFHDECTKELERYYKETKKILVENRSFLDSVASNLMDKKTLTYHEILDIKNQVYKA